MKRCSKILVAINIIFLLSYSFSGLAVFDATNVDLDVIEEIIEPILPRPPQVILPIIYDLLISKITLDSATIEWKTNKLALCQLFWGETQEYKQGIISGTDFLLLHKAKLPDLSSGTRYHFKVVCQDELKNETQTPDQHFITLFPPDIIPPLNVSDFKAIPGDRQIELKWKNSPDPDFKGVRIVRSEEFYPSNPWEGTLVYDGVGTSFIDAGLTNGKRYYYTAFTYDFAGNFSSGAVVSAVPRVKPPPPPEEIFAEEECLEAGYYWYDEACRKEPPIVPAPPEVEKLILEDFDFIQAGRKIAIIEEDKIEIETEKPLTVLIDYEKVPEVLKTIMVTLEKDEKFFSFLLRINQDKTAYQAVLAPPEEPGIYSLKISVLDYKNQILRRIFGKLIVFGLEIPVIPPAWYLKYPLYIYIYILMLIALILLGMIRLIKKLKTQNSI